MNNVRKSEVVRIDLYTGLGVAVAAAILAVAKQVLQA